MATGWPPVCCLLWKARGSKADNTVLVHQGPGISGKEEIGFAGQQERGWTWGLWLMGRSLGAEERESAF
jgi:hypothetical protein